MSTKTIAVESSVYDRLAKEKRGAESFTRTISRLMEHSTGHTCGEAVADAAAVWGKSGNDVDADRMESLVRAGRAGTDWSVERPE
jgi:predicted CopG family antitoxin